MDDSKPPARVKSDHDGGLPSMATPSRASAARNQPSMLAEEPSFPAGNASPIFSAANVQGRAPSPFPVYQARDPAGRPPSPFPQYPGPEPRVLTLEYPPDIQDYPSIIDYIMHNFDADFPRYAPDDFYDLWTNPKKLGLKDTRAFFHWLLREPPEFYEKFYPSKWQHFRPVVINTRIILDFIME